MSSHNFDFSSIMFIIIILVFLVIVFYYFWYIKNDTSDNMKDVSISMLHEPEITIIDLLKNTAEKYPNSIAMKHHDSVVTYSEYYDRSRKFAKKLLCDIGPNTKTGIICTNRPERLFTHMGTMMSGGVSIGIDFTVDIEKIINESFIDILVTDSCKILMDLFDVKMPTVKKILYIDIDPSGQRPMDEITSIGLKNISENNNHLSIIPYNEFVDSDSWVFDSGINVEFKNPHPEDIAQIIYDTNENERKGITITHKNIISSLKSCLNIIQSKSNICVQLRERFVSHLSLNDTIGQLIDMYMPIISCGTVYFPSEKTNVLETLKEAKPTIFLSSPSMWNKLIKRIKEKQHETQKLLNKLFINKLIIKEIGLDEAKYCIIICDSSSSSDGNVEQLIEQFEELGIELCKMYGIKEVMGPVSMGVPGCSKGNGIPIVDVKIDQNTNEITIKGDQIFKEYQHNKQKTKEIFNKGWMKLGKCGYLDRSGFLFFYT